MPYRDYDRYAVLKGLNGSIEPMPFIKLPVNTSDKYEFWNSDYSRLDKLSMKYYGNPFYDFLILYANGSYTSEFDIQTGDLVRIPFPLDKVLSDYEQLLTQYKV